MCARGRRLCSKLENAGRSQEKPSINKQQRQSRDQATETIKERITSPKPWSFSDSPEAFRKPGLIYGLWNKATFSESSSRLSTSSSVELRQKWVYARAIFQRQVKTLAKRLSLSLSSYHKLCPVLLLKQTDLVQICSSQWKLYKPLLMPSVDCEIKISFTVIIIHQNVLTSEMTLLFSWHQFRSFILTISDWTALIFNDLQRFKCECSFMQYGLLIIVTL